ncbi:disulfide bond formation protein B [uncultured Maritalea sp.]|uniref:disulfide bond formation protein B n=1 Tax=uncultured Maritalea sp. TaxID=757249 RepID=UPI002629CD9E|nr:disulfide bond formation protein B [uncultured Maritalea sp.]
MIELNAKNLTVGVTALAAAVITSAYGFQYIGGYIPCDLCYEQRNPYYITIPLLLITLFIWDRLNANYRTILLGIVALIFAYGTWMAGYHSGVEWSWWPGPDTCTGVGAGIADFADLQNINDTVVIPCDRAQVRFFGLSFAGMNAIVSLFLTCATLYAGHLNFHSNKK